MTVQDLAIKYMKDNKLSCKELAKMADVHIFTLRSFLEDKDILLSNFKKIVFALESQIEIRPRKS